MNTLLIRSMTLLLCLALWLDSHAQFLMPEPNWDRSLALHAAHLIESDATIKPLFRMARSGNNEELLDSLRVIEQDPDISSPARDYLLFSFTLGLGDLEANAVSPEVLDFLSTYEVRTLVAHDEHPHIGVPLFNIRGAALGVRNAWDRQQAASRALNLMPASADLWILSYLSASRVERRGFVDALHMASAEQLQRLGHSALARLDERPELTVVAARAGLESGDFEMLRQSITRGSGPGLPGILKAASDQLSTEENIRLLDQVLQLGSDTSAALAIAQLAPAQLDEPAVREMLFNTLANRNLGAVAALVLAASADPEIQDLLNKIASQKDGLARQRASLAIRTRQTDKDAGL